MNCQSPLVISIGEYIRAAADHQLSSSASNLLRTLLNEEDQLQYNQLLNTSISIDIHHLLHQVRSILNYLHHHHLSIPLGLFTSPSLLFCRMDGYYPTQKTSHPTTFTRSHHHCCLSHTLGQISTFIITNYRLWTSCSILSHRSHPTHSCKSLSLSNTNIFIVVIVQIGCWTSSSRSFLLWHLCHNTRSFLLLFIQSRRQLQTTHWRSSIFSFDQLIFTSNTR